MGSTRVCPTANGLLHVGHAALCCINAAEAKAMGGKFLVRIDDSQNWWQRTIGPEKVAECVAGIREDLDWLGLDIAEFKLDTDYFDDIMDFCRGKLPDSFLVDRGEYPHVPKTVPEGHRYPWCPWMTAVHVVQDYRDGITKVIRGEDLISEFGAYCAFCEILGLPIPEHVYVPRVREYVNCGFFIKDEDLADVSKSRITEHDWTIRRFRDETNPKHLISRLADVCLTDRNAPWTIDNLRPHPQVYEGFHL